MHFISFADMSPAEIEALIDRAEDLKRMRREGVITDYLKNRSLAMIFEKSSTRTRVSFEVGMTDLGGHALYLDPASMQLGRGETVADTGRILSSYVHGIMVRANDHDMLIELAKNSTVPVINGLSDREHPCQAVADLMTIREQKGKIKGLKFVWVGDGNNVCNSLMLACAMMGMEMVVACPKGYEPNQQILEQARSMGGNITITRDPKAASKDADVLYTDVWVSMGQEAERAQRFADLRDYQINMELVGLAKKDCLVMHCLPAHRGEEITDDAIRSPNSVIFEQAQNRLHAQKALLIRLMGKDARTQA
ncbi:ornithine carbamoyltransferase [Methanocella arvoryzae]|uniref:Ornithine carbamoyltransferase n=1 Tax=Methanocella arvoryzae (strain DSM 22066 / NBRC 105507 / MRE50) TaxID=351160 RepID=Q0W2V3_METAR|nr:ornithine carbamoyltransferase [Methanocella arvoryzae]CAJ37290.1 ornithine carbamoyltransferase [Methanocella arvoryzae MRE50]